MPTGKIKLFNADRGYGFIVPDGGGPDMFFHVTALETQQEPKVGQSVTYETGVDKKNGREKATNVR